MQPGLFTTLNGYLMFLLITCGVCWFNSTSGLGFMIVGIRYQHANDGKPASFGEMLGSTLFQACAYIFTFGICGILDFCKFLSSEKRQGIAASAFNIYPVAATPVGVQRM